MITKSQCREWIDALRSGKYKQGRTELHGVIDGEEGFAAVVFLGEVCLSFPREERVVEILVPLRLTP